MHAPWRDSRRRPTPLSWKLNPVPLVLNLESWAQRTRTLALTDTTTVPMFLILILLRSSRCARTANFTRTYLYDEQRDVINVALRGLSCGDSGRAARFDARRGGDSDGDAQCLVDVAPFKSNAGRRGDSPTCRDVTGRSCEGDAVVLCLADSGRAARSTQVDATDVAPFKSDARRGGDSGRAARSTQVDATGVAPFKSDA